MDQGVDRAHGDANVLQYAQNCRMSRAGRLEVRPGFTALSSATYSSADVVVFDVANYAGRLVALGSQVSSITTRPTDLFEWVESAGKWRATSGDNTGALTGPRLPRLTDVRAVGQVPDLPESIHTLGLAAGGGYVCAVFEKLDSGESVVHVFDPETDQTILLETVGIERPVVVYSGSDFWIVGHDADEDIVATNFDPSTDETLPAPTTLISNATAVVDVSVCTFGSLWALAYCTASSAVIATYNSSGVQQQTWTAVAAATESVALASNGSTLLSIAYQDSSSEYFLSTFDALGSLQNGPTSLFGGDGGSGTRVGLAYDSLELVCVGVDELNRTSLLQRVTQSSHSTGTTTHYRDARPEGAPVVIGSTAFVGFVDLTATDFTKGTYHVIDEGTLIPQCFVGNQLCDTTTTGANEISAMAADGSKLYFGVITVGQNGGNFGGLKLRAVIYEAETSGLGRRQMTQVGGELLISGGLPLVYDGRTLAEQGFAERPVVEFSAEDTTGALDLLGVYRAIGMWEVYDSKGRLLRSQASDPVEHTLTGSNDAITWRITTPHSLRRHPAYADQGVSIRVSVYRTEGGEGVFYLDGQTTIDPSTDIGSFVTIKSTASDTQLQDNLVLYEQSQAPVSHVSPPPYRYGAAARERALLGGVPESEAYVYSKLLFPGEPVEFAPGGRLGFTGRVSEPITAVGAFETVGLVWTSSSLWAIPGRGPEHNGDGDFDAATPVATPGGADEWRSVLVTPPGAFFRMRPDRLMLLDRGFNVSWAGGPVQDTLAAYPNMTGVAFVRELDQVVFACNDGDDSALLVYDLAEQAWSVDTISGVIDAVAEVGGRLVYVEGGTVYRQDAEIGQGSDALPTLLIDSRTQRPFSAMGLGDVERILLLASYVGDCTLEAFISYDGNATWESLGSFAITQQDASPSVDNPSGVAGGEILKQWIPNKRTTDRFAVRVQVTNATNTGGIRLHYLGYEATAQSGASRRPSVDTR